MGSGSCCHDTSQLRWLRRRGRFPRLILLRSAVPPYGHRGAGRQILWRAGQNCACHEPGEKKRVAASVQPVRSCRHGAYRQAGVPAKGLAVVCMTPWRQQSRPSRSLRFSHRRTLRGIGSEATRPQQHKPIRLLAASTCRMRRRAQPRQRLFRTEGHEAVVPRRCDSLDVLIIEHAWRREITCTQQS